MMRKRDNYPQHASYWGGRGHPTVPGVNVPSSLASPSALVGDQSHFERRSLLGKGIRPQPSSISMLRGSRRMHWSIVLMLTLAGTLVFYSIIVPEQQQQQSPQQTKQPTKNDAIAFPGDKKSGLIRVVLKPDHQTPNRLRSSSGQAGGVPRGGRKEDGSGSASRPVAGSLLRVPSVTAAANGGIVAANDTLVGSTITNGTEEEIEPSRDEQASSRHLLSSSQSSVGDADAGSSGGGASASANATDQHTAKDVKVTSSFIVFLELAAMLVLAATGTKRAVRTAGAAKIRRRARDWLIEAVSSQDVDDDDDDDESDVSEADVDIYDKIVFTSTANELGYGSFGRFTYLPRRSGSEAGSTWTGDYFDKFDV